MKTKPLTDLDAVNNALRQKLLAEVAIEAIEGKLELTITPLKAAADADAAPHREKIEGLDAAMHLFWEAHRDGPIKSIPLTFGTIGERKAPEKTSLRRGWKMSTIVGMIQGLGDWWYRKFVREPEPEVNKKAVLMASDDELEKLRACGISIEPGEPEFYAKTDRTTLAAAATWPLA
jgi:phage host-nuclease inhibitor protein Gam